MAKGEETAINTRPDKGLRTLQALSVQLVSYISDVTQFLFFVIARRPLEWPSSTVWFSMRGSSSGV
jgi:hypothetical protein